MAESDAPERPPFVDPDAPAATPAGGKRPAFVDPDGDAPAPARAAEGGSKKPKAALDYVRDAGEAAGNVDKEGARIVAKGATAVPVLVYDVAGALQNLMLRTAGAGGKPGDALRVNQDLGGDVESLLDKAGATPPKSAGGRIAEDAASGAVSAFTGAGLFAKGADLAKAAGKPVVERIMRMLAEKPGVQAVSGATGGATAGAVREGGGGPLAQSVAGILGGALPFGAMGVRANLGAASPPSGYKMLGDTVEQRLAPTTGNPYEQLATLSQEANAQDIAGATRAQQRAATARTASDAVNRLDTPADAVKAGDTLQRITREHVNTIKEQAQKDTEHLLDKARAEAEGKEKAGNLADGSGIKALVANDARAGNIAIGEGKGRQPLLDFLFPRPKRAQGAAPAAPNPNVMGAPGFLQRFSTNAPAAAAAPTSKTTFAKLSAAEKEIQKQLRTTQKDTPEFTARMDMLNEVQAAMEAHAPSIAEYKEQYAKAMEPANQILKPGSDAANAIKLQAYIKSGLTGSTLRDFEMAPEDVMDAFLNNKNRGAQKIKLILGDGADDYVRKDMARRVQGMSAEQLKQFNQDHELFLREFPDTQKALHDTHGTQRYAEGQEEQAQKLIEQTAGRDLLTKPEQTRFAIQGWIRGNNTEKLSEVMNLVKQRGGSPEIGRDAVASWLSKELGEPLSDAAREVGTPEQTSTAIKGIVKDWKDKRGMLVESGVLTAEHAHDLDSVMRSMDSFATGTGRPLRAAAWSAIKAQAQIHDAITDIGLYETMGYKGVLLRRMWSMGRQARDAYQRGASEVIKKAITDPEMARDLAARVAANPDKPGVMKDAIARAFVTQLERDQGAETTGQGAVEAGGDVAKGVSALASMVLR